MVLYYIYCIWVKTEQGVLRYYGHTENMRVRKNKHVAKHKAWAAAGKPEKTGDVGATRSVYVLEYEDWRMDVKATIEHESKEIALRMAEKKEGEYILENDCVNMQVAGMGMTKQEYNKYYHDTHREQNIKRMKQYNETHKEQFKEKITCDVCGSVVRNADLARHRKSKKHLNALASASE